MNKFKMGDFVVSKNYGYELEVMFVDGNTFSGRFTKGKKKNLIENYFSVFNFEKVKEDKMENRIVRKLEDLDGLENGKELKIELKHNVANVLLLTGECELLINSSEEYSYEKDFIKTLKAMGFKFEYKPLRTVDEVLEEMKDNSLKNSSSLYEVRCEFNYEKNERIYSVFKSIRSITLGTYVFSKETAQKYVDELNKIVGCK